MQNHMSEMFAFHATMMSNTLGTSTVVFTRTGFMAILLSHYRPSGTIFAFTNEWVWYNNCTLLGFLFSCICYCVLQLDWWVSIFLGFKLVYDIGPIPYTEVGYESKLTLELEQVFWYLTDNICMVDMQENSAAKAGLIPRSPSNLHGVLWRCRRNLWKCGGFVAGKVSLAHSSLNFSSG